MTKVLSNQDKKLICHLFDLGAVKIGEFTLKTGIKSPIYFDLRVIICEPTLTHDISVRLLDTLRDSIRNFHTVCGVPYTALPLATCISVDNNVPMLIRRKEAKDYGTKKILEGVVIEGDNCLIVEDVITSGTSVMETAKILRDAGCVVTDVIVLLDREQGGRRNLLENQINVHSVFTLGTVISVLVESGRISAADALAVKTFVGDNQCPSLLQNDIIPLRLKWEERVSHTSHPVNKRLFSLMAQKRTNICVAADCATAKEVIKLADAVGPYICILKTHVDTYPDFDSAFVASIQELAIKHNFLLFEDRKFCDIGNTVLRQFGSGVHAISSWSEITTVHPLAGAGVLQGMLQVPQKDLGYLLVAQLSCEGNLISSDYSKAAVKMAVENKSHVMGFICQQQLIADPAFIHVTPGISLNASNDSLGQKYTLPRDAVLHKGADVLVVGRGVYAADDPIAASRNYRDCAYEAYLELTGREKE